MKHFSHFIAPGAVGLGVKGHWAGVSLAFENPDGNVAVMVENVLDKARSFTLRAFLL